MVFLLERDFGPILEVDMMAIESDIIYPKELYLLIMEEISGIKKSMNRDHKNPSFAWVTYNRDYYKIVYHPYYVITKLLHKGFNPGIDHNSLLKTAVSEGNVHIVKLLLDNPKVKPNDTEKWSKDVFYKLYIG